MTHLLYLDIWGTSAKLLPGEKTHEVFGIEAFSAQKHFLDTLFSVSTSHPELLIQPHPEQAWVRGANLESLVNFAVGVFQKMAVLEGVSFPLPVRGVLASGEIQVLPEDATSQATSTPWFGDVATIAARVEKTAQKGFRLFVEKNSAESLMSILGPTLIRESNAKGLEAFEVNWLKAKSESGLDMEPMLARLQSHAKELVGVPDPFAQTLGSTISDLIRW